MIKSDSFDLIVVGDGVAARALLQRMSLDTCYLNKKILQISSSSFMPPCTFKTTSVVSDGIFEPGISPLGDDLYYGLDSFKNYYEKNSHIATKSTQYYIYDQGLSDLKKEQFFKRYGPPNETFYNMAAATRPCYLINPQKLMSSLMDGYASLNIQKLDDVVVSIDSHIVKTRIQTFSADQIILCTSAYTSLIKSQNSQKFLQFTHGKAVAGSYLQKDNVSLNDSFTLSRGHYNLIYRKSDQTLLFGGTSYEGMIHAHQINTLQREFEELTNKLRIDNLDLEFSSFDIKTGIRHKGRKRMPICMRIDKGIYLFSGFYKNGFTLPFYKASQLISILKSDL